VVLAQRHAADHDEAQGLAQIRVALGDALWRVWPYLAALRVAPAIVVAVPWLLIGVRKDAARNLRQ
jgi:hypothetical protein